MIFDMSFTMKGRKKYLMQGGSLCASATGGWVSVAKAYQASNGGTPVAPTVTQNSGSVTLAVNGNYGTGLVHTANKINLSRFNALSMQGSVTDNNMTHLVILSEIGTYAKDNEVAGVDLSGGGRSVDVSNLTGAYYIAFRLSSGNGVASSIDVTSLWLE